MHQSPGPTWKSRAAAIAIHALLLWGLVNAWSELVWAGGVDLVLNRGQTEFDEARMSVPEIDDELSSLKLLLDHRPDDAEGHLRYAALHVVKYRQLALVQMRQELGTGADDAELWTFTSPMVLHQRAAEFAQTGDAEGLAELRADPVIRGNLDPAVQHARLARTYGPLLCQAHQLLGQLGFLIDDPRNDEPHIVRATRLLPQDPAVRYWAGVLHFQSGRLAPARENWRRCLALSAEYDDRILPAALEQMPLQQFVDDLLPDSPEVLLRIADRRQNPPDLNRLLGAKLLSVLESADISSLSSADIDHARARGCQLIGKLEQALEHFERATARSPVNVAWRMQLASLLRDLGRTRDAVREAEVCVRLDPQNADAQRLLVELSDAALNRTRKEPRTQ